MPDRRTRPVYTRVRRRLRSKKGRLRANRGSVRVLPAGGQSFVAELIRANLCVVDATQHAALSSFYTG